MDRILAGLLIINGKDVWTEYGVFLAETKRGGMDNLAALLTPSKTKAETAVDIRELNGEKYAPILTPRNQPRDVELQFALFNKTRQGWLTSYFAFINFLKQGNGGWLDMEFPQIGLNLHVRYTDSGKFQPLTYLWQEGVHAGRFKVKFREPDPII